MAVLYFILKWSGVGESDAMIFIIVIYNFSQKVGRGSDTVLFCLLFVFGKLMMTIPREHFFIFLVPGVFTPGKENEQNNTPPLSSRFRQGVIY